MKKNSHHALHGIILLILLLIVLALLLAGQHSGQLQSSLESGRFEAHYTSAIDALKTQTQAVRDKLNANMPGDLEILPEKMLRKVMGLEGESETPEKPTLDAIRLRGIYWSKTMPLAEINDRLCKPGEEIAGFTLEEIQPYQIILSDSEGNRLTNSLIRGLESNPVK